MSEPAGKYTTNHPTDSVGAACPVALDEPTQAQLDHLYWTTDTPVREIARQLGLAGRSVCSLVTPLPAGFRCYRCRTEHHHTSRSGRAECSAERRWPRPVTCTTCGERRRPPSAAVLAGGLPTERSVIAVRNLQDLEIDACVEALARIGKGWDEHSLIMLHDCAEAIALGAALAGFPPGTLAIPSLRDLGASQAERLQTLWAITRYGWRVVTAHDAQVSHSVTRWDLDHAHDDSWESSRWHHESEPAIDGSLLERLLRDTSSAGGFGSVVYLDQRRTGRG
jgi:hypothetical protein